MKISLAITLTASIVLGASGMQVEDVASAELSFVQISGTERLGTAGDTGFCCANFEWEYPVFVAGADTTVIDSLNRFVRRFWPRHNDGKGAPLSLNAWMDRWLASFGDFLTEHPSYSGVGISGTMIIDVTVNAHGWLGLASDTYMYGGGAHGNQSSDYFNFDPATGTLLSLSDVVGPENVDNLTRVGEAVFRQRCGIGPEDPFPDYLSFADSKFQLNGNFSIDSSGLFFYYNDYEIAAYAYGPTKLVIPWDRLETIVDSTGRLRPFVEEHRR